MSIAKGLTIEDIPGAENYVPKMKWVNGRGRDDGYFVVRVLNMYLRNGEALNVRIPPDAVWRMINADRGTKYGFWFDPKDEKDDLDDDAYLGFSYIQARYYISISTMLQVKRLWKQGGRNGWSWFTPIKRVRRGGRPIGGGKSRGFDALPDSEKERIENLAKNYRQIAENCYKKDWVTEYVELERDMALIRGEKFIGKQACIRRFAIERKHWLDENT